MSESIFETSIDERGNISVQVSREVQVLTREEADRIGAEYKRMQAENASLRELLKYTWHFILGSTNGATSACEWYEKAFSIHDRMLALGIEV